MLFTWFRACSNSFCRYIRGSVHVLIAFVEKAYFGGRSEVLVITGKGLRPDGQIGVLRRDVPLWLNEDPIRSWIRGFSYAAKMHGGEGALYILIRKIK